MLSPTSVAKNWKGQAGIIRFDWKTAGGEPESSAQVSCLHPLPLLKQAPMGTNNTRVRTRGLKAEGDDSALDQSGDLTSGL